MQSCSEILENIENGWKRWTLQYARKINGQEKKYPQRLREQTIPDRHEEDVITEPIIVSKMTGENHGRNYTSIQR